MTNEAIVEGLTGLIRAHRPGASEIRIEQLKPVYGGNSSQMFTFDARWSESGRPQSHALVLRRAAPSEFQSFGREAEFRLLKGLGPTAVPVPEMFWMDAEGRWLERPAMVMERVSGTARRRLIADDESGLDAGTRAALAAEIPGLLAAIHEVDLDALGLPAPGPHPAAEQLAIYDAEIRRQEVEPIPELRLASLWLHDNLPAPPAKAVLVHGDFRPANLLVDSGRITAVLDWEFAHAGDPTEDIGWYLTPYYAAEHFVPGAWSAEDFLSRYEAARGIAADRQAIAFWSVFAMYKLASMTMAAVRAFVEGDTSRMAASTDFILDPLVASLAADGANWGGRQ